MLYESRSMIKPIERSIQSWSDSKCHFSFYFFNFHTFRRIFHFALSFSNTKDEYFTGEDKSWEVCKKGWHWESLEMMANRSNVKITAKN